MATPSQQQCPLIIPFEWDLEVIDDQLVEVAMLIRVNENEFLQLDTGSTRSWLYPPNYRFSGTEVHSFKLSQQQTLTHTFQVYQELDQQQVIGTLGANFFSDGLLLLDFANQRVVKATSIDQLELSNEQIDWLEGDVSDWLHITTQVSIGNITITDLLFDSGSSMFPLVVNQQLWQQVVDAKYHHQPPIKLTVPSWEHQVTLLGAPSKAPVQLGCLKKVDNVFYCEDPMLDLNDQGLNGLIGNRLIRDQYNIILDYQNKRLGLIASLKK